MADTPQTETKPAKTSKKKAVASVQSTEQPHILSGIQANFSLPQIGDEGEKVDFEIHYYKQRAGSLHQARTPYLASRFIEKPIIALKMNPRWQARTNATDEQMDFIAKTPIHQLHQIQNKINTNG